MNFNFPKCPYCQKAAYAYDDAIFCGDEYSDDHEFFINKDEQYWFLGLKQYNIEIDNYHMRNYKTKENIFNFKIRLTPDQGMVILNKYLKLLAFI